MVQPDYDCQCYKGYKPVLPGTINKCCCLTSLLYDHFICIRGISCHVVNSCLIKRQTDCKDNCSDYQRWEHLSDLLNSKSNDNCYDTTYDHRAKNRVNVLCLCCDCCHRRNISKTYSDNDRKSGSKMDLISIQLKEC